MTELRWIDAALTSARPQAVAALLRYFRDLDTAEEAFQEACLRALKTWPEKGPPRDPAAWLIFVGRNAALDTVRRQSRDHRSRDPPQSRRRALVGELRRQLRPLQSPQGRPFARRTGLDVAFGACSAEGSALATAVERERTRPGVGALSG